ncbi:hypothetical protein NitYY0826_C1287 [Nitratiruptor sp. YY08-26]|uniref:hypothetical protein n=1 Tax=unclassified Nitratiruptor TaxID=2624044 RepID=UPI0019158E73|nr:MULTISPECIES: hypothetical protein [unclassified Nitratiruptor]BCD62411.1 hypothetical protein NitYY0813_C1285 [Nitratiruptor sp. YY08-13]BCD66347.1 hypothetical protein NitYY0826_C1287 [Nitratiruptor sp. YY08-26]
MKILQRAIWITLLFAAFLRADYSGDLKNYLLSRTFIINGEFFLYKNRWIFGAFDKDGKVTSYYTLLGEEPTSKNPFGWKYFASSLNSNELQEAGYFVKIDFPYDLKNSYLAPYSWLYIDRKRGDVYKLVGADNGIFKYYDSDFDGVPDPLHNLYFNKENNKAQFYSCKDKLRYKNYRFTKLSKNDGAITYDCHFDSNKLDFEGRKTFEDITTTIHFDGTINGKRLIMQINKDFKNGTVSYEGLYNGRYIVCSQNYKAPKLNEISATELDALLNNWGEGGPEDPDFISGNCEVPQKNLESMEKAYFTVTTSHTITDINTTSHIRIWEHVEKN